MNSGLEVGSIGRMVSQVMSLINLVRSKLIESELSEAYTTIYGGSEEADGFDYIIAQILAGNPEILIDGLSDTLNMDRGHIEMILTLAFTSAMGMILNCDGEDAVLNIETFMRRAVGG